MKGTRSASVEDWRSDWKAKTDAEKVQYFNHLRSVSLKLARKNGIKVLIDNQVFTTMQSAANFTNISERTIKGLLNKGPVEYRGYRISLYEGDE